MFFFGVRRFRDVESIGIRVLMFSSMAALLLTLGTTNGWTQDPPDPAKYKLKQPEPIRGDTSSLRSRWSYFPDGDELHDLEWSPKGDRIALVQQVHWPDGGAAHNYPRWALRMLSRRAQVDPRFADPRIMVVTPGSTDVIEVDFGWSPRFSPDGSQLAYARQDSAISGLRRMVASTGSGNPIVVFDIKTRTKQVWATPKPKHQFLSPRWIDSDTLLVRDCYATNGQLLGCPDLVRITRDGKLTPIKGNQTQARARDSSAIFEWRDDQVGASLLRVGAKGIARVAKLQTLPDHFFLVNGTEASPIGARGKRAIYVADGRWHTVNLKTGAIKRRGRSPFSRAAFEPNVFASPRGGWVLYSMSSDVLGDGIYLSRSLSKKSTRIWAGPGVLMRAQWTPKERKLAWIVSRRGSGDPDTRIAGDELIVFDFPRKPARKSVGPYKWESDWGP